MIEVELTPEGVTWRLGGEAFTFSPSEWQEALSAILASGQAPA